jgi:hypothetical protein
MVATLRGTPRESPSPEVGVRSVHRGWPVRHPRWATALTVILAAICVLGYYWVADQVGDWREGGEYAPLSPEVESAVSEFERSAAWMLEGPGGTVPPP